VKDLYVVGTFMVLIIFVPMMFILGIDKTYIGIEVAIVYIIIIYSSVNIVQLIFKGYVQLISLTYWLFCYVFLGITPLLQQISASRLSLSPEQMVQTSLVVILGMISFSIGVKSLGTQASVTTYIAPLLQRTVDIKRILFLCSLFFLITPILIIFLGGIEQLFIARSERYILIREIVGSAATKGEAKTQIFTALLRTPFFIFAFMLLAIYLWAKKSNENAKTDLNMKIGTTALLVMIISWIIALLINNPISTARFWLGTILLSAVFLKAKWNRFFISSVAIAYIFILLVVFPFVDIFRNDSANIEDRFSEYFSDRSISYNLVEKRDFDAFHQLSGSIEFVSQEGLAYGKQLIGTALFWFPRSIWSDKPLPTGVLIAKFFDYENINLSLPLWGELYLDGGLILVIVGFWAYGVVVRVVDDYSWRARYDYPTLGFVIVVFYAAYQTFLLRGTLMSAFAYLVPGLIFIYLCTSKNNNGSK